jgi:hypothetical protein
MVKQLVVAIFGIVTIRSSQRNLLVNSQNGELLFVIGGVTAKLPTCICCGHTVDRFEFVRHIDSLSNLVGNFPSLGNRARWWRPQVDGDLGAEKLGEIHWVLVVVKDKLKRRQRLRIM